MHAIPDTVKITQAAPNGSSSSPSLGQLIFFSPLPTPEQAAPGCNHNAGKGANHTIDATGTSMTEGLSSDNTGDRSPSVSIYPARVSFCWKGYEVVGGSRLKLSPPTNRRLAVGIEEVRNAGR